MVQRAIVLAIFVSALWIPLARGADPRWIRLHSGDFEILTTAGESDARRLAEHLERAGDFLAHGSLLEHGTPPQREPVEPVHIVLFGSPSEFEPYRPNEAAAAFYRQTDGRDYIVLGGGRDDVVPSAIHEYTHWIVQRSGLQLPPWLNEGIAELYSTMKPAGGKMIVGSAMPGRLRALAAERWTPLAVILDADQNSPYYNEKSKAGGLYNEAWALTHMLAMTPSYAPKFASLVRAVQTGIPSREAIETIYGKSLEAIESDLGNYIRKGVFKPIAVNVTPRTSSSEASGSAEAARHLHDGSETVRPFDVKLTLLAISAGTRSAADLQRAYDELAALDPQRAEPQIALGYLAWRARDQQAAVEYFARAIELGSRIPDVLWSYGQLAAGAHPPEAARALAALLVQQPDRTDARLLLAELQFQATETQSALNTLAPIRSMPDEEIPRFARLKAFANSQLGRRDDARLAARMWSDSSRDPADVASAQRFLEYLDRADRLASGDRESVMAELWAAAPGPDFSSVMIPDPPLPSVAGQLVALDCEGNRSRLVVQADRLRSFEFEDGEQVMAFGPGARSAHVGLTCGKFRSVAVRVQYEPPDARSTMEGLRHTASGGPPLARAIYLAALPEPLDPRPASVPAWPARPHVSGAFVDMDCRKQPPKLVLRTASEREVLLLDDVRKLEIGGLPMGSEIACGPQQGKPVWIEYEALAARQAGVVGSVRVLHFEPPPSQR